jgi:hypothetical protein
MTTCCVSRGHDERLKIGAPCAMANPSFDETRLERLLLDIPQFSCINLAPEFVLTPRSPATALLLLVVPRLKQ